MTVKIPQRLKLQLQIRFYPNTETFFNHGHGYYFFDVLDIAYIFNKEIQKIQFTYGFKQHNNTKTVEYNLEDVWELDIITDGWERKIKNYKPFKIAFGAKKNRKIYNKQQKEHILRQNKNNVLYGALMSAYKKLQRDKWLKQQKIKC